jgi:hypothetical protein
MDAPVSIEGDGFGSSAPSSALWRALDDLLDTAPPAALRLHGLGALAAKRLRRLGRPVPALLEREERAALLVHAMAAPLLRRVREACDEPLILIKGPEIAQRYPPGGRSFGDIDLLSPRPEAVQRSLLAAGFMLDERARVGPQHLKPLILESLPLAVEVHRHPKWPEGLRPPGVAEILEASSPSRLEIEGLLAPGGAHHALILATHSWEHRPLRLIRDLLDIALITEEVEESRVREAAAAWDVGPIWRTTRAATEGVFFDGRKSVPLRTWARHVSEAREMTVFESHLEHWMSPFWGLPLPRALGNTLRVFREEVSPLPGESWRGKGARMVAALRHAPMSKSRHDEATNSK